MDIELTEILCDEWNLTLSIQILSWIFLYYYLQAMSCIGTCLVSCWRKVSKLALIDMRVKVHTCRLKHQRRKFKLLTALTKWNCSQIFRTYLVASSGDVTLWGWLRLAVFLDVSSVSSPDEGTRKVLKIWEQFHLVSADRSLNFIL